MKIVETSLPGVLILEPKIFADDRGFFLETYHLARYAHAGVGGAFVQDNFSRSARGTLRGLHFQEPNAQGKLVYVTRGSVFDVAVDIRRGSPTFGRWCGTELSEENHRQMWIPGGFAHGFCVTSDTADFTYKCTEQYVPAANRGILWNDPDLGIDWPVETPLLSAQDRVAPRLRDAAILPTWAAL
jgi:dTDP-4-dehydrorhamnose 3,5-epimerase